LRVWRTHHNSLQLNQGTFVAQTTFYIDKEALDAITELRQRFGAKTNGEVIGKALALARVAAGLADERNMLTIVSPEGVKTTVALAG
jgi:hypothetical protein